MICIVIIITFATIILSLKSIRKSLEHQKQENEKHLVALGETNKIIDKAIETQKHYADYLSTGKIIYLERFKYNIRQIDTLTLSILEYDEFKNNEQDLIELKSLLKAQAKIFIQLQKRLSSKNPIEGAKKDTLYYNNKDLAIDRASLTYDINIRSIRKEITQILTSDKEISNKISDILSNLHHSTIESSLRLLNESTTIHNRNNATSIYIGISSSIIIILLSFLILSYVRKNKRLINEKHKLLLSVSHDIKTPLGSIMGYLDCKIGHREVVSMQNSAKHILALLDNLIQFSSIEKGTTQSTKRDFNLKEITDDLYEMFLPLVTSKGLILNYRFLSNRNLSINGDDLKIKQIIANLLSNSIKYSLKGEISFIVSDEKGILTININDTGIGISKENIDKIFSPYTRIESGRKIDGSGLGLYVVKGLIDVLKGSLSIESQVNIGTQIKVSIPINIIEIKDCHSSKNILIIEDDPTFRTVVKTMLLRLGHNVTASEKAIEGDFDTIISDYNLPDTNINEIAKQYANSQLIIMSGDSSLKEASLYKPFSMSELERIVGGTIDRSDTLELFGDDSDSIKEVIESFLLSTADNLIELKEALAKNELKQAQMISHRMLPMSIVLKYDKLVELLRKIDTKRGLTEKEYPEWKEDISKIIKHISEIL